MVWATKTEKVRAYNNKKEGLKFAKVNAHQYVKTSAAMTMQVCNNNVHLGHGQLAYLMGGYIIGQFEDNQHNRSDTNGWHT